MTQSRVAPTLLVVDDEKNIRRSIEIALESEAIHVLTAHDAAGAYRLLDERAVDVLILDIRLGDIDGIGFFKKLQADGRAVPTIFISGHATLTEAAQAVKIGGFDFLEKPFSAEKLVALVRRCLEFSALKERLQWIESRDQPREIVGESAPIRKLIDEVLRVAASEASVLITGESGSGKELVASMIHAHGERRQAPFVKVNCSAIPENLLESELFGYDKGAFTGATAARKGLFEMAHRGTLFLDEVADLSASAQAKILRALQSGEIQKVGANHPVNVDVRVLCGTHKDLKQLIAAESFREDLYYRLNVVPIRVPALRERADDIPLLTHVLLTRLCQKNNIKSKPVDEDVLSELQQYHWPGNVRELQNVLERMLIMSGERITLMDLPEELVAAAAGDGDSHSPSTLREHRDRSERDFIIATLKRNRGNISQAAVELGVRRPYLHRRLAVLGISKRDFLL
jgi:two-component system nitrogen regulation response regulator NtrX